MSSQASKQITQWVKQHGDALYSWALYKTSSKETAEDLVQDTFIVAFDKFDSFENRSQSKTWLFSILNNKIIDHYRKNSKTFIQSEKQEQNATVAADNQFDDEEHWKETSDFTDQNWLDNPDFNLILANCIKKLPDNWQFVIQSKYILDKESSTICQELKVTPSNYWQMIHRSKLLLKKCIETNWIN